MEPIVAIVGAGFVGMQIAIAFANAGIQVIAYDNNKQRLDDLRQGIDKDHEIKNTKKLKIEFTHELTILAKATNFIVTTPTPIDKHLVPDLLAIQEATKTIGTLLKKEDVVVFESTIFPGATEELLIPILEQSSGLRSGIDFYVGYSPERIIPGDKTHGLDNGTKVISGQNKKSLDKILVLYQTLSITLHVATTIKVAESCKLLENIQRDVNIALMNEYAQIMDGMGISMRDVLNAAKTKWNFLPFNPGLVGGHCIPVDPYYLIYKANEYGFSSPLIRSAREINEKFVDFIFHTLTKLLSKHSSVHGVKVALLGISFKPNVPDIRHSLSLELYKLMRSYGMEVYAVDPIASHQDLKLQWMELEQLPQCEAILLAQEHEPFLRLGFNTLAGKLKKNGVFIDIPGVFAQSTIPADVRYWGL